MTFKCYEVKTLLHISHMCHDIFPPFKYEEAVTNRGWAAGWIRLKVKGYWATFNGHEVKNVHALHTCAIISSHHLNMNRLWQLGAEQQPT